MQGDGDRSRAFSGAQQQDHDAGVNVDGGDSVGREVLR
jgi:hypothetical protein